MYRQSKNNLLSSNTSSTCPDNMVNFGLLTAENQFGSLGHPYKFQRVLRLRSVTARHLVVGVSQTLRHWTEGAKYVWQGDHHVGHWSTFLVALFSHLSVLCYSLTIYILYCLYLLFLFMAAICNRAGHMYFHPVVRSSFFLSLPNLSRRRLDVYHTSTNGVALVRI